MLNVLSTVLLRQNDEQSVWHSMMSFKNPFTVVSCQWRPKHLHSHSHVYRFADPVIVDIHFTLSNIFSCDSTIGLFIFYLSSLLFITFVYYYVYNLILCKTKTAKCETTTKPKMVLQCIAPVLQWAGQECKKSTDNNNNTTDDITNIIVL